MSLVTDSLSVFAIYFGLRRAQRAAAAAALSKTETQPRPGPQGPRRKPQNPDERGWHGVWGWNGVGVGMGSA
jgi:hypothetical protein